MLSFHVLAPCSSTGNIMSSSLSRSGSAYWSRQGPFQPEKALGIIAGRDNDEVLDIMYREGMKMNIENKKILPCLIGTRRQLPSWELFPGIPIVEKYYS